MSRYVSFFLSSVLSWGWGGGGEWRGVVGWVGLKWVGLKWVGLDWMGLNGLANGFRFFAGVIEAEDAEEEYDQLPFVEVVS